LSEIIEDRNYKNEIAHIEKHLLSFITPKKFEAEKSVEIKVERDYEALCAMLSEHTNRDVKRITVKEFYALLVYVKKKLDKNTISR